MSSSAICRSVSIAFQFGCMPLFWVSSDIDIRECVTRGGLVKDALENGAHLSYVFPSPASYHVVVTSKTHHCMYHCFIPLLSISLHLCLGLSVVSYSTSLP